MESIERVIERINVEIKEDWSKWLGDIQSFKLPPGYSIKVIPPVGGAMVRFCVTKGHASVSVFLDCHGALGYYPDGPYWEVYPVQGGDILRFGIGDMESVLDAVKKSIRYQRRNQK